MPMQGMNIALVSGNTYKLSLKHTVSSNPVTTTDKRARAGGKGRDLPEQACCEG